MSKKYKFSALENKIYNFVDFPNVIHVNKEEFEKNTNYLDLISEELTDLALSFGEKYEPYRKEIEEFYMEEYSIIESILRCESLSKYNSIENFLNSLLEWDELEIKNEVIYRLLMHINDVAHNEEDKEKAIELAKNNGESLKYIKGLPFGPEVKWNLFCVMEDPLTYMKKYVRLMEKLLPIFEKIYGEYEEEVIRYGENMIEGLNKKGSTGLMGISNGIVNDCVIDSTEINFIIAIGNLLTITVQSGDETSYVVWGMRVSEVLEKIKESHENRLNERILLFKNLGDKTRYEVLKFIAKGITSTKEIAEELNVSSATISYHISNLATAKIIKMDKENGKFRYLVNYEYINECIEELKNDIEPNVDTENLK